MHEVGRGLTLRKALWLGGGWRSVPTLPSAADRKPAPAAQTLTSQNSILVIAINHHTSQHIKGS